MTLLDLQGMELPQLSGDAKLEGGGKGGSNISLIGCTPHEKSSLSVLC